MPVFVCLGAGWDKDLHYVVSTDFFKSPPAKTVPCGNLFEIVGHKVGRPSASPLASLLQQLRCRGARVWQAKQVDPWLAARACAAGGAVEGTAAPAPRS